MAVAGFAGSIGSFARIQEFLDAAERLDERSRPSDIVLTRNSQSSTTKNSSQSSEIETEKIHFRTAETKASTPSPLTAGPAIQVEDGNFGWTEEKPTIVSDVNLKIWPGDFAMIVGPVGCGKSTMLKALLGELPFTSGTVHIAASQVAFCDQTPWHMNGTVQDSILAISKMDLPRYRSVLRACALEEDLRQLPKGDKTLIGSKGIALSGGQSQRIVSFDHLGRPVELTNLVAGFGPRPVLRTTDLHTRRRAQWSRCNDGGQSLSQSSGDQGTAPTAKCDRHRCLFIQYVPPFGFLRHC